MKSIFVPKPTHHRQIVLYFQQPLVTVLEGTEKLCCPADRAGLEDTHVILEGCYKHILLFHLEDLLSKER